MFKQASCENEVAEAMLANLKANQAQGISKFASTVSLLADASEMLDKENRPIEAEALTRLIEEFAKTSAFQDLTLAPEDRLFFDKLPEHHKTRFKKMNLKEFSNEVRRARMEHELTNELEQRNRELGEFESLLPRGKQLPESSFPQDVVEFNISSLPKGASIKSAVQKLIAKTTKPIPIPAAVSIAYAVSMMKKQAHHIYSDPSKKDDPTALPDIEIFHAGPEEDGMLEGGFEEGWYWIHCSPGFMPKGDPEGPFATEREAEANATENTGMDSDSSEPSSDESLASDVAMHAVVVMVPKEEHAATGKKKAQRQS